MERGFIPTSCGMDAGLPAWFAIERWLPALFESRGLCGYTPKLWFGVSMAEALIVTSVAATIASLVAAVVYSMMFKSIHDPS